MKRVVDFVAASVGLILLSPLLVLLMLVVFSETRSNPIFAQQRIGRGKKIFTCYKLRTMAASTGDMPTHLTPASAVTKSGKWLRKSKLDELPQLWNVLTGQMSLVGPRPCLPSQTALINARAATGVFEIRPGISGLAQVNGIDMSNPERLAAVDTQYVRNVSLANDANILLATIFGKGVGVDHVAFGG
jgi:O-antigen biosynthesis protein WbqP